MPRWFRRVLALGDRGADVAAVQRLLGAAADGVFDEELEARVRGVQRKAKREVTGVVDEDTAGVLGEVAESALRPEWFERPLGLWAAGDDVRRLRCALDLGDGDDRFTPDVEAAVRRLQSANGLPLSGEVGEAEARLIGGCNCA